MKIEAAESTVVAMLECYEASTVAWRILSKVGEAFMTIDEDDAIEATKILANRAAGDTPIVAGESGAVSWPSLCASPRKMRKYTGLGSNARVLLINTEDATDPDQYEKLTGLSPDDR